MAAAKEIKHNETRRNPENCSDVFDGKRWPVFSCRRLASPVAFPKQLNAAHHLDFWLRQNGWSP